MNSNALRLPVILLLGVSSGLPLALTGSTLQAWMKTENIDLAVIGLFSFVGLPYAFKVIWAPLMDRFTFNFLGRRRGWILVTQLAVALFTVGLALVNPREMPWITAALAFLLAFMSASQDIVIDAYRVEVLNASERGLGASLHIAGYRIAMLISGALALIAAQSLPWRVVYVALGAFEAALALVTWFAPEPAPEAGGAAKAPQTLLDAIVLPLKQFLKRPGVIEILLFIVLYKLDAVMANALTTPFMLELGFSLSDIGAVNKVFGLIATIVGTLVGGIAMVKIGVYRSLWVFGLFQAFSGLSFLGLAHAGKSYPWLVAAIGVENLCTGMGTSAFAAFLMGLCDRRYTATQYALLTSLMALTRVVGAAPTGYLVKAVGWQAFFIVSTLASIPSLLLLMRPHLKWAAEAGPGPKARGRSV